MERPAHLRLNLQRKTTTIADNTTAGPKTADANGDKFSRAFRKGTSISSRPPPAPETLPRSQPHNAVVAVTTTTSSTTTTKGGKPRPTPKTESEIAAETKAAEVAKQEAAEALEALERREAAVMAEILALDVQGPALATAVMAVCAAASCTPRPAVMLDGVLGQLTKANTPSWTRPEAYGAMLAAVFAKAEAKTLQMAALYRVQAHCHALDFPKGLIEAIFMNLYQHDVCEEEAFLAYKYDLDDESTPGKMKAIIQLTHWLDWLENAKEEDDGDSDYDEDEEAEYMEQAPVVL